MDTAILKNKEFLAYFLIVLFHAVGLAGFLLPSYHELFKLLVPAHLLLMLGIIFYFQEDKNKGFWLFTLFVALSGYFIEVIGVHTGAIFGKYQYGNTLGFKLMNVPLMIGINWVLMVYSVGILVHYLKFNNLLLRCFCGAGLLVLTDILIEPTAMKFDYWNWDAGFVPHQNYLGWYFVSFAMLLAFEFFDFKKENKPATALFLVQLLFFLILAW